MNLDKLIRDVHDFPKKGIVFKDITPLLCNPSAMSEAIDKMTEPFLNTKITAVAGVESRGFLFGPMIAQKLNCAFIPIRKPGKLPYQCVSKEYDLEYGKDKIEMHIDAVTSDDTVLIVDDLLATGGTINAAYDLITEAGAKVIGSSFLVNLSFLNAKVKCDTHSVLNY